MTRPVAWVIPAILLNVVLAGCGGPYATPESSFRIYRDAIARKDWTTSLGCFTPQSQDKILAGLLAGVATASVGNKDAAAVLEKHGIDRRDLVGKLMGGALANLGNPREGFEEGVRRCLETIADRHAFVGDGMSWVEKNNRQVADNLVRAAQSQLSDVRVEGDSATGQLSVPMPGGETSLRFKRIDGRWLIDL